MTLFVLKYVLLNGMSSIKGQKTVCFALWAEPNAIHTESGNCSSSVLRLQNGNCNIYFGNVFKHYKYQCIGISHISSQWDLHFSDFEIATLALPWVPGTFCYLKFIKNFKTDNTYTFFFSRNISGDP